MNARTCSPAGRAVSALLLVVSASLVMVLATLVVVSATVAAPIPSIAPVSWELGITYHDPDRITVELPGSGVSSIGSEISGAGNSDFGAYWYLLYTVTNESGREVEFYPSFEIVTDALGVVTGGEGIHPRVYEAVDERHRRVYPFFVDPARMVGAIRQGADNAKTSAIAFPPLDPEVNRFTLYVGGLSGEIVKVRNWGFDPGQEESESNARSFLLRKTLAITYDIPGDRRTQPIAKPVRVKEEWVMR